MRAAPGLEPVIASQALGGRRPFVLTRVEEARVWDALVLGLPDHDLRQGWRWGEVARAAGFTPLRYAASMDGRCVAAIQALARRIPGTPATVLYAPRGPLVAGDNGWAALRSLLSMVAAETRTSFLRVSPGAADDRGDVHEALVELGFVKLPDDWTTWNTPRIVMTLDLTPGEEQLRRGLRRRLREYISAAGRKGLGVRAAGSPEELRGFHAALVRMGRQKGYPVRSIDHLKALWEQYVRDGEGVLLLAEHEGAPVGGLFGTRFGRTAHMLYASVHGGGADRHHQGPLLYWEFVRWALASGCNAIDWGGSGTGFPPRETDPGYGVYHFKLGFGSTLRRMLGYYDRPFRARAYSVARFAESRLMPLAWRIRARLNR